MKKRLFVPALSLLFLNTAYAGTAENVNELISTARSFSYNKEKFSTSLSLNEQAQVIAEKVEDTSPVLLLRVLTQKMDLHIKSGQLDEAQKICSQILAFKEKKPKLNGPSYAEFLHKHAELLLLQEQPVEAEKASLQAVEIFGKNSSNIDETRLDEEFAFLGKIYMFQKNWDKAESYLRLAVFLNKAKEAYGVNNTYKKNAALDLIKVYQEMKRDDLAKQVETEAQAILNPRSIIWQVAINPKYKAPTLVKESCKNPAVPHETTPYSMDGTTELSFFIGDDGEVVGKYVASTSGWKRLDEIVLNAIAQCKFNAATFEERPTRGWMHYTYYWEVNSGGKPYPKPTLAENSCKSDRFNMIIVDTNKQSDDISFKIDVSGLPHSFDSELLKKNGNLYFELIGILKQCRFSPTIIDGEIRGNKAIMRFVRKQPVDKDKASL